MSAPKRKRMTPSQRLDFERACNTIAIAILVAAVIVSTRGGCP